MQTVFTDSLDSLLRTIGKPTEKKHSITSLRYWFSTRSSVTNKKKKYPTQGIKVRSKPEFDV